MAVYIDAGGVAGGAFEGRKTQKGRHLGLLLEKFKRNALICAPNVKVVECKNR